MSELRVAAETPPPPSEPSGLIHAFGRGWEFAKDFWSVLRPMRFCVFVWIAISALILVIPQSQDALLALLQDVFSREGAGLASSIGNAAAFAALAFFWAFQTFYWARFASRLPPRTHPDHRYPPPVLSETHLAALNYRLPHWLGALVLVSIWLALLRANWGFVWHELAVAIVMLGLLAAYVWLVWWRRNLALAIHRRTGLAAFAVSRTFSRDIATIDLDPVLKRVALSLAGATLVFFLVSGFVDLGDTRGVACIVAVIWIAFGYWAAERIGGLPRSTIVTLHVNLILFGLLFVISVAPSLPIIGGLAFLSSAPIIMSVAAAWVFLGTFLLAVPGELLRLPLTTIVVVLAVIAGLIGWRDNHLLRQADNAAHWQSTSLEDAFDAWWNDVGASLPKPAPLVLVATAGGASRAAYWTAEVLGKLEADHPGFHRQIFAISSVSGGSLGAVVYRAMLNDLVPDGDGAAANCDAGSVSSKTLLFCGRKIIDNDFLGPTFLTGLYADLTQRFLPGALLPDRAAALERSWEQAWHKALPHTAGLEHPFHELWPRNAEWLPALLINGTSEKSGRRIITSNLRIDHDRFPDAIDFFGGVHTAGDIPISTAIHNSARFPYIDAAGTLVTARRAMTDRIVDGGYFENFGASTIYDLLAALNRIKGDRPVKFFVVQISSDPDLAGQAQRDIAWQQKSPLTLNVAADATAPPVALFNVGSALGYRATRVLAEFADSLANDRTERYAHFALTSHDEVMSWVLSRRSVALLDQEWPKNQGSYDILAKFMGWR